MASAAGCLLTENRADSAYAYRLLIEDRRKVVLCGAGEHVAPIHQRESSPMITPPDGSRQRSVKSAVGVPAQAAVRERVRRVQDALEDGTFSWNDRRHTTDYHRAPPARSANVRLSLRRTMLRHRTEPRGDRFDTVIAIPVRVVRSPAQRGTARSRRPTAHGRMSQWCRSRATPVTTRPTG